MGGERQINLPLVARDLPPTATPSPTPSATPQACNDLEPNSTLSQARLLTSVGRSCIGGFDTPANDTFDWYFIDLAPGQTLGITLSGIPAGADYDIQLFNAANPSDPVAESTNGDQADEQFVYRHAGAVTGRYLLRINAYRKGPGPDAYLLGATLSP
jgi:hypothetical protein